MGTIILELGDQRILDKGCKTTSCTWSQPVCDDATLSWKGVVYGSNDSIQEYLMLHNLPDGREGFR